MGAPDGAVLLTLGLAGPKVWTLLRAQDGPCSRGRPRRSPVSRQPTFAKATGFARKEVDILGMNIVSTPLRDAKNESDHCAHTHTHSPKLPRQLVQSDLAFLLREDR